MAADGAVTMDAGGLAKPGTQARATGNAYELASADTRAGPPYAYESPPAPSTAALPGAGSGWASLAGESTTTLPRPQKKAARTSL